MFQIISDSGCDFTKEEIQEYGIDIVPFYVTFDEETHLKEGVDISKQDYFKRLVEEKTLFPKTAQPSPQDYVDVYTPHLKAGKDIISLTISSKVSGTYNSATLAATMLQEEYPDRTILVIDSLNGSVGQGLILREIIKMRDKGYAIRDAAAIAEQVVKTTKIYFTVDTLEYLKRGGRVGPTTALVGGILGLRPVLHLVNGSVEQLESVRGTKRVMQLIEEGVVGALAGETQHINLSLGHIFREEDVATLKSNIEAALGMTIVNPIAEVGVTIGTHAGPGALVVAYCKKYETFVQ
ncbi:MAG: DegV family protein [Oscillospiraceae bacterium]|nr:DegV family protein [Oscillospiraceae bacterium]